MRKAPPVDTPGAKLAALASVELRKAELNEQWGYLDSLLHVLWDMGARVMRLPDERYRWRSDYIVEFHKPSSLPGTFK